MIAFSFRKETVLDHLAYQGLFPCSSHILHWTLGEATKRRGLGAWAGSPGRTFGYLSERSVISLVCQTTLTGPIGQALATLRRNEHPFLTIWLQILPSSSFSILSHRLLDSHNCQGAWRCRETRRTIEEDCLTEPYSCAERVIVENEDSRIHVELFI